MRTNIDLSEELIQSALKLSGLKTKKAVVNQALKEFLERQAKLQILKLQGELVWEGDLSKWRTTKYE